MVQHKPNSLQHVSTLLEGTSSQAHGHYGKQETPLLCKTLNGSLQSFYLIFNCLLSYGHEQEPGAGPIYLGVGGFRLPFNKPLLKELDNSLRRSTTSYMLFFSFILFSPSPLFLLCFFLYTGLQTVFCYFELQHVAAPITWALQSLFLIC